MRLPTLRVHLLPLLVFAGLALMSGVLAGGIGLLLVGVAWLGGIR